MSVPAMVNSTRAIPSGMLLRISHRPGSILRTAGIPIGQPYWTVLMSAPIACLAFGEIFRASQSRTGSFPETVL